MSNKLVGTVIMAGGLLVSLCVDSPKKTENSQKSVQEVVENTNRQLLVIDDTEDDFYEDIVDDAVDNDSLLECVDSIEHEKIDSLDVDSDLSRDFIGEEVSGNNADTLLLGRGSVDSSEGVMVSDSLGDLENCVRDTIFLTIDDGPGIYTLPIAEKLYDMGYRATFFFVGENVLDKYYSSIQRAVELGHEVGNHSYSHANFRKLLWEGAKNEVLKADEAIHKAGVNTVSWFRYPYGSSYKDHDRFDAFLASKGYKKMFWTVDTRDWDKKTKDRDLIKCFENVKSGDVILIHERPYTVGRTLAIMDSLLGKKFVSVPLSEGHFN